MDTLSGFEVQTCMGLRLLLLASHTDMGQDDMLLAFLIHTQDIQSAPKNKDQPCPPDTAGVCLVTCACYQGDLLQASSHK